MLDQTTTVRPAAPTVRRPRLRLLRRPPAVLRVAAVLVAAGLALLVIPPDAVQGDAQRIMYVHVPMAWLAYLAFLLTFAGGAVHLATGRLGPDRLALAAAEIGVVFTGLTLVTGSVWGRMTWGVWWDWDPRMTTTLVLFLLYAGYLLLRTSIDDRRRRARLAAVLGIVAFVDVPVDYFSVTWWRGLHQPPTLTATASPPIDPAFLATLLLSLAAFTLVFGWLLRERIRLEEARDALIAAVGER